MNNKKNEYALYLGPLKNDVILALVTITPKSISLKSQKFPQNQISESLLNNVRQFLTQNNLSKNDINAIYVNNGPSRFNSDRLITLTAKTLACFGRVPLYAMGNLELHLLAANARAITIDVDQDNAFLAYKENGQVKQFYLAKDKISRLLETSRINPIKIPWMTIEEHQDILLRTIQSFKLIEDPATLGANYVKPPLKNDPKMHIDSSKVDSLKNE
ncbi:tRNA A37 threonylcarbamoyladenosine modification protein TsaB [Mycoplasmoides fastidiosum]|uniref:tRNA A37 threonylcarbamoyladenosine modification protein TsaB n=1 Tax=Mycoplasmoides fastidiosum TaxID=92758 RepID=A0ABU0LYN9_9BACT|nr:hypothetical protein [Mycoplasmoides fastidiosum]MDQ0513826.1 tRNA A37 threonylcarbamoyladenosine modification protein TsaB [Mycoplasmoides fastidiosum]UUD37757.1 hypothetical protein NPA10_04305 [Mycoplasmoides fastidiosum]